MEPIFPFLHYIGQHGEEQVFKVRGNVPNLAQAQPVTPPQCHPHHCPPPHGPGPGTPLGSQHSIHHLIQLANLFQTSARISPRVCGERPREEPGQGVVAVFLFSLSLQHHTHPELLAVSLVFFTLNCFPPFFIL